MVHTGALALEERVLMNGHKSPTLLSAVKEFLLYKFSHKQYLSRQMQAAVSQGKFTDAAGYAIRLGEYESAFTFYNQAIARGDWQSNVLAAELAEMQEDYQRGLTYRLNVKDYGFAGIDALHLGHQEEAKRYFRKLRDGS